MTRPRQLGDRALEALDGLAENELLAVDHLHERADDFIADGGVLGAQVEQWDRHDLECAASRRRVHVKTPA
jgi:hypothetical protein